MGRYLLAAVAGCLLTIGVVWNTREVWAYAPAPAQSQAPGVVRYLDVTMKDSPGQRRQRFICAPEAR